MRGSTYWRTSNLGLGLKVDERGRDPLRLGLSLGSSRMRQKQRKATARKRGRRGMPLRWIRADMVICFEAG
jgi:hypothetical protein